MMLDLEAVQLHHQHTVGFKALVFRTAMRAATAEKSLIPSAACFDISHCYEGLWSHPRLL
jgi:hypothetical protein